MSVIEIPPGERGVVRVFALSMDAREAKALRASLAEESAAEESGAPDRLRQMLGTEGINRAFVEVFPISDIREIGLDMYLEDGHGIEPAQLDPDRPRLKALDGWVLLVYSGAFGGRGARLDPAPELTLVGTYAEPGVDWSERTRLSTAGAEGTASPAKTSTSDAAMSGRVAVIALLVLFVITAVMIWIAA